MNLLDLPERRATPPELPIDSAEHERRMRAIAAEEFDTRDIRATEFIDDLSGELVHTEFVHAAADEVTFRTEDTRTALENAWVALREQYIAWRIRPESELHDDVTREMTDENESEAESWTTTET